jgi:hypothetical protein
LGVKVKLAAIADDFISSYLDVDTGQVHSITEEELDLSEASQTHAEDTPDWQREAVELSRNIRQHEGKRYLAFVDLKTISGLCSTSKKSLL